MRYRLMFLMGGRGVKLIQLLLLQNLLDLNILKTLLRVYANPEFHFSKGRMFRIAPLFMSLNLLSQNRFPTNYSEVK